MDTELEVICIGKEVLTFFTFIDKIQNSQKAASAVLGTGGVLPLKLSLLPVS